MSSIPDYCKLQTRIDTFEDVLLLPWASSTDTLFSAEDRKQQTVINLSVSGFHSNPASEQFPGQVLSCHACGVHLQSSDWNNESFQNVAYICSLHKNSCVYYRIPDFHAAVLDQQDIRVSALSKPDYFDSLPIRVFVGSQPNFEEFSVHEGLICPRSEFFCNSVKGPWKESEERTVNLSENEPDVFRVYLKYLYTGTLAVKNAACGGNDDSSIVADEYATLSKLFVLAEKLMDEDGKTAILAAISARSQEPFSDKILYYPAIDSVQIIYEGTPEHSPARKLLVTLYTNFVTFAFVTEKSDAVPKDFLHDLSLSLLTQRPLSKTLKDALDEEKATDTSLRLAMEGLGCAGEDVKHVRKQMAALLRENTQLKANAQRGLVHSPFGSSRAVSYATDSD
ncbi:hypothetical protein HBI67_171860 [Parastagonospora nodorum]|nr:hypothetical protein HBI83_168840 [Parastagonospora nodorum]KAH6059008.1 hypothetical protein HBI67_171860 [Parastagonospora nodorum]KAH6069152.1 hypothetical protein HBI66_137020 [Parastagonospora nodorum]